MEQTLTPTRTALMAVITFLLVAAPAPAQTGPGYALCFNGASQFVTASVPALASNYTVSAWVFLHAGGDLWSLRVGVLSSFTANGSVELLVRSQTHASTDPQYLELGRCGAFDGSPSTAVVPTNQWVHLAVTVNSSKQVSYYINGAAAGVWNAGGLNVTLGPNITLADNYIRRFDGLLDEVQIWSRALEPSEVRAGMTRAPDTADPNLVAYWPFSEGRGTASTADASGQGHYGTLVGRPAWVLSACGQPLSLHCYGANPLTNECPAAFVDPGAAARKSPLQVAAGGNHSLALKADGTVVGWGYNSFGQANGAAAGGNVVAIAAGFYHSLALKADGTVVGWGHNNSGQANGAAAGGNVVTIAAGFHYSLALKADGTVVGWGNNANGRANGAAAGSNVVAIAAGDYHGLALKADGTVVGWGDNNSGQTNGAAAGGNVVAIAAGAAYSLALKADGTVVGWGDNNSGQANGAAAGGNVVAIAAGAAHSLALKADGTVVGWGYNDYGQANGAAAGGNVVAIAAGQFHSLALKADGTVVGWGRNSYGQISVPGNLSDMNLPVTVSGTVDANALGTYSLTYTVTNIDGSLLTTNRTVVVVDTTAPIVTLSGDNPMVLTAGTPFVEPGASASDACVGDLTASIVVTGSVDASVPGNYTLHYAATDGSGNTGSTNRTVWVVTVPAASNLEASCGATNAITGIRTAELCVGVNPNGLPTTFFFQYGLTTAYPGASALVSLPASYAATNLVISLDGLGPGVTYHWRVVASNRLGVTTSPDQLLTVPALFRPGDTNGDGKVDLNELNQVIQNYRNP